jgi:tetratricopeptide (TPR) repeat protein
MLSALGGATLAAPTVHAAPASSSALDEAKALYAEGKSHYDVGDYEKALGLWKQAYAKLDDSAEMQTVRHTLVYNILEAQIRVYEVNKDITYLRRAKTLLESYLAKHREIYSDTPEAVEERKSTEVRLAEVEEMLANAEQEQSTTAPPSGAAPAPAPAGTQPTAGPPANETPGQKYARLRVERLREIERTPELKRLDRRYKAYIIGGGVGLGVGLIMLTSFAAMDPNPTVFDPITGETEELGPGRRIATGAIGGLLTIGGGVFLGIGAVKRKKLRQPTPAQTATFAPYATPNGWGVAGSFSF